jgi:putative CocE/NonD family hydrolase
VRRKRRSSINARSAVFCWACIAGLVGASGVRGQTSAELTRKRLENTRSHYTKYEFRIPMRDGVKLFTIVYAPKDTVQRYPILIHRTPYSVPPYGIDNYKAVLGPSELFTEEGFIFVYQDVRGRYLSEGTFVDNPTHQTRMNGTNVADESTDSYDTVDWLVKHVANNNGKVGMWGYSYSGFFAAFSLIDSHPALKAVAPEAPMADVGNGDDAYHNGAFFLAANFDFYSNNLKPRNGDPARPTPYIPFQFGTPDGYDFYLELGPLANANKIYLHDQNPYWNAVLEHPNYDEFWKSRALAPLMKNVQPAVLLVGGWFDAEDLAGPLKLFRAVEKNGHVGPDTLVMGPWPHGGWRKDDGDRFGNLDFASKTGQFFRENIELPFFVRELKDNRGDGGKAAPDGFPKAWVFRTGTNDWHRFDSWPPQDTVDRTLYLDAAARLSFSAPSSAGFDEYVSDPSKPVPVMGEISEGMRDDFMSADQRFASKRPDVLVYQTGPLDHDITVAGPMTAILKVSTSGTDSDFVVKLIDVYPNDYPDPIPNPTGVHMGAYQQLVRGEPFRGKFRNSLEKPEPFVPGEPSSIEYVMPDVFHTFRPGHKIMVQIQSSWFPLIDRNPQKFVEIPLAKPEDFGKATNRVYWSPGDGSRIRIQVLN